MSVVDQMSAADRFPRQSADAGGSGGIMAASAGVRHPMMKMAHSTLHDGWGLERLGRAQAVDACARGMDRSAGRLTMSPTSHHVFIIHLLACFSVMIQSNSRHLVLHGAKYCVGKCASTILNTSWLHPCDGHALESDV